MPRAKGLTLAEFGRAIESGANVVVSAGESVVGDVGGALESTGRVAGSAATRVADAFVGLAGAVSSGIRNVSDPTVLYVVAGVAALVLLRR